VSYLHVLLMQNDQAIVADSQEVANVTHNMDHRIDRSTADRVIEAPPSLDDHLVELSKSALLCPAASLLSRSTATPTCTDNYGTTLLSVASHSAGLERTAVEEEEEDANHNNSSNNNISSGTDAVVAVIPDDLL
jgi:hypothetical protein